MARNKVVVIGGGLAGLTAAYRLCARADVVLIEAAPCLGGQIATDAWEGSIIERGGEGFVARSQALPALCADLGMPPDDVIAQATLRSYGYDGHELKALAPGEAAAFLGFQVAPDDLGKGIRSLRRGMGSLTDALAAGLQERADVRLAARALAIASHAGSLRVGFADGFRRSPAMRWSSPRRPWPRANCSSRSPGNPHARSLPPSRNRASRSSLAFARAAIDHALDGSGFVVTLAAQRDGLRACTFSSSKFEARAPADCVSLRAFFRPSAADLDLDDSAWVERAQRGIDRVLTLRGAPLHAWVSRWPNALPVFDDAHRARVAALESVLHASRIVLAGAAFHGSGIDAAVRSGEGAAQHLDGA